jgi:hypothetical protein
VVSRTDTSGGCVTLAVRVFLPLFSIFQQHICQRLGKRNRSRAGFALRRLPSTAPGGPSDVNSFTEQYFDSCGIFKDAVISILATIAKQERIRISERVKAGVERARRRGTNLGRPKVFVDRSRMAVLRSQGLSWAKIADAMVLVKGPFSEPLNYPPKSWCLKLPCDGEPALQAFRGLCAVTERSPSSS